MFMASISTVTILSHKLCLEHPPEITPVAPAATSHWAFLTVTTRNCWHKVQWWVKSWGQRQLALDIILYLSFCLHCPGNMALSLLLPPQGNCSLGNGDCCTGCKYLQATIPEVPAPTAGYSFHYYLRAAKLSVAMLTYFSELPLAVNMPFVKASPSTFRQ